MSDKKRPYYDPQLAAAESDRRIILRTVEDALKALPKGILEFGKVVILPNPESEFRQGITIKRRKQG